MASEDEKKVEGIDFFSKGARGGVIASNINYQDLVGIDVGAEIISNKSKLALLCDSRKWAIMCEGDDDLELHMGDERVYIQVKNQTLAVAEFKKLIKNFESLLNKEKHGVNVKFHIALLKGVVKGHTELVKHIAELERSRRVYRESEYKEKVSELSDMYSIPKNILTRLSIKEYGHLTNDDQGLASYIYHIRQAFPIQNFSDKLLKDIYIKTVYKFSTARLKRETVKKDDFLQPIEGLIKYEMSAINYIEYQKTKHGYFKNLDFKQGIDKNHKIVKKVYWRIWREWFKHYGLKIILPYPITKYEICPKCTHPLMANLMGINGIACPDCGFFPFFTLILVCDCGEYTIIKKQPEFTSEEIFLYINTFVATTDCRCEACNKDLSQLDISLRTIGLPFPLPIKDYEFGKMNKYLEDNS